MSVQQNHVKQSITMMITLGWKDTSPLYRTKKLYRMHGTITIPWS